jgi:hypothetical protein
MIVVAYVVLFVGVPLFVLLVARFYPPKAAVRLITVTFSLLLVFGLIVLVATWPR